MKITYFVFLLSSLLFFSCSDDDFVDIDKEDTENSQNTVHNNLKKGQVEMILSGNVDSPIGFTIIADKATIDWGDNDPVQMHSGGKKTYQHHYRSDMSYTVKIETEGLVYIDSYYKKNGAGSPSCTYIKRFAVGDCHSLRKLDLATANSFEGIDISKCSNLDSLILSHRSNRNLHLENKSLRYLDVNIENGVPLDGFRNLDLDKLPNIEELNAYVRSFKQNEPLKNLSKLRFAKIRVQGNVDNTEFIVKGNSVLEELDLKIDNISKLEFTDLPKLKTLSCGGDGINTHIAELDLSSLNSLETLFLDYRVDKFVVNKGIKELSIVDGFPDYGSNPFKSTFKVLNLNGCKYLEKLNLCYMYNLESLDLKGLDQLNTVYMEKCGEITFMDFADLKKLESLEVIKCESLQTVNITNAVALKVVNLESNNINSIEFANIPLLDKIRLSANDLSLGSVEKLFKQLPERPYSGQYSVVRLTYNNNINDLRKFLPSNWKCETTLL